MMPLVRREDNCTILYQVEDGDVAVQSFPVIVKSEETPDEGNTDDKEKYMDVILLQMKIGTLGLPTCEKFSIVDVCKDRASALTRGTTFGQVSRQLKESGVLLGRFAEKCDELEGFTKSVWQVVEALKEENERLKEENESLKRASKSPK